MSKELIDRLKSYIPSGDWHNSQYANDLADAVAILEAKSAPVGEREAFEVWLGIRPCGAAHDLAREAFKAGAAYQRAQQPQSAEAVAYKDDPRSPSELSLAGCNCVRYGENNPHWPFRIHTTPQPSAGVVMPQYQPQCDDTALDEWERGWNACLDEFARLNGKEVGRG